MQNKLNENIKKILIIRLSSIGDIILTTELIRLTKKAFGSAEIDFLVFKHFASVLEHNPHIDNLIKYDKSLNKEEILSHRSNYDLIIDLQNNSRSRVWSSGISGNIKRYRKNRLKKLSLVYLKTRSKAIPPIPTVYLDCLSDFNIKSDGKGLEFWLEGEQEVYPPSQRDRPEKIKIIGIAPSAHHPSKQWPKEYFKQLISDLDEKYDEVSFFVFGGKDDTNTSGFICHGLENIDVTDFTGKLSISGTAQKIDECDLLISNDTGLVHIATARRIKLLVIFGSTVPELGFAPYASYASCDTNSLVVENNSIRCRPCTHIGRSKCPKSHLDCLKTISTKDVADSVEKLFPINHSL